MNDGCFSLGASAAAFGEPNAQGTSRRRRVLQGYRREQPTINAPRPSPSARLAPHEANAYKDCPAR